MDDTRFIALSGHSEAIPLTASASGLLMNYLADARGALAFDPDSDEIVRDVEMSLGDTMRDITATTGTPVTASKMAEILAAVGTVSRADGTGGADGGELARGPFWCRIDEGKWFGGLCLGVAARGKFRIDWVRTIAIFVALVTGGLIGIVYLALLLVLPRVQNVREYERLRDAPRSASIIS